ncbi:MAG: FliM/FliN family flagellar motor switch protein [Pseudomonadota bacterium]
MSSEKSEAGSKGEALVSLFGPAEPPILEDSRVLAFLEQFALSVSDVFLNLCTIEVVSELGPLRVFEPHAGFDAEDKAIAFFYGSEPAGSPAIVLLPPGLPDLLVELVFGGAAPEDVSAKQTQSDEISELALDVSRNFATAIMSTLQLQAAGHSKLAFEFDRTEQVLQEVEFESGSARLFCVQINVGPCVDSALRILIPEEILKPLRARATTPSNNSVSAVADPTWTPRLHNRVLATVVDLNATVDGPDLSLGDVARLQIGSVIELDAGCLEAVHLNSSGRQIFKCKLGQSNGYYTVNLVSPIIQNEDEE